MPKIRILPEQLANRIAAGEVVERPASVVKELLENSLDAASDRIEVEVEGGGSRLIRVVDNGEGMDEDDILLCFERHGTSKISDAHDLVAISTLGFRGEAIPSIASVAKMTIVSRPADTPLGTQVDFEYGRLQKVHETGCRPGTQVDIRNLFAKTPARKKFLRTIRTELGHIEEVLKNYALACPDVTFSLSIDGKETFYVDRSSSLEDRLRQIMHYRGTFIEIGKQLTRQERQQLHGYLVPPEQVISAAAKVRLFINGRAIKDRLMSHAVFEGLRGFLLKGHSPAGYLHLRIAAEDIDVNVHPAKHEVRFRNSSGIHQYIKEEVTAAMHVYQGTIGDGLFGQRKSAAPFPPAGAGSDSLHAGEKGGLPLTGGHRGQSEDSAFPQTASINHRQKQETSPLSQPRQPLLETREASFTTGNLSPEITWLPPQSYISSPGHRLHVIGQIKNLYIFCQSDDGLVVIDQHAAHERLLYEKFRQQYGKGKVASQTLMFAETVELTPFQIELVETHLEEIGRIGFSISAFGGNSYIITAVPAIAGKCSGTEIFIDVLASFGKEGNSRENGGIVDTIFATMACKAAVKAGDELSTPAIEALLQQMAAADLFSHCPHGRPVLKRFSTADMKKWFHRT